MKFRFVESIDKEEVVVYARERNDVIDSIENICVKSDNKIIGYDEGIIKELNPILIECFYTCGNIFAYLVNCLYYWKTKGKKFK